MVAKGQGTQRMEDLVVLGTRRKDDHEVHGAHQCGCGNFNNEIQLILLKFDIIQSLSIVMQY